VLTELFVFAGVRQKSKFLLQMYSGTWRIMNLFVKLAGAEGVVNHKTDFRKMSAPAFIAPIYAGQ